MIPFHKSLFLWEELEGILGVIDSVLVAITLQQVSSGATCPIIYYEKFPAYSQYQELMVYTQAQNFSHATCENISKRRIFILDPLRTHVYTDTVEHSMTLKQMYED